MSPANLVVERGVLPMPNSEETAWRRVWVKSVMIDAGKPLPTKIRRPAVTRRMSLAKRLEKLHRMRAALEQSRSWMAK
jgi:hypothetical protein